MVSGRAQLAGGRYDYEYAYFPVHAPVSTPASAAIDQAGFRRQIEEDNEQGKRLTGLDPYQVRRWTTWHRSVTYTMLAHAFPAVQRAHHLNSPPAPACEEPADPHDTINTPAPQVPPPQAPDVTARQIDGPGKIGPMIRRIVAVLAGLLILTGLAVHRSDQELLRQHHWRAEHQTAAAISHYQRRGDPLPPHLRPSDSN